MKITSLFNPRIKQVLDIKKKRSRYRNQAFLIEGPHLVEMALASGSRIKSVYYDSTFLEREEASDLLQRLSYGASEMFEVSDHVLSKISDAETCQGIIATASCLTLSLETISLGAIPLFVIIDGIQDPGNLGTIIRTSDAFEVDAVIVLPGACEMFSSKVIRSTSGSIFTVPLVFTERPALIAWLSKKDITLLATSSRKGISINDAPLSSPVAFIFGNEAHGVSEEMTAYANDNVRIPIHGHAESLNVASSAAICLYEASRQRNKQ